VALRIAGIIEESFAPETFDDRCDLVRGKSLAAEGAHDLALGVVPKREAPERIREGVRGSNSARAGLAGHRGRLRFEQTQGNAQPDQDALGAARRSLATALVYSMSNDCMVRSISSEAMSELD